MDSAGLQGQYLDRQGDVSLRIEMQAINMPAAFVLDHTEGAADYDFVMIKDQNILLPTDAEVLSCKRGTFNCSRNAIDFREYKTVSGSPSCQNPPNPSEQRQWSMGLNLTVP
jgi:hypothetical protein